MPKELPATTLANYCYRYMYQECVELIGLPSLPATKLTTGCYDSMFKGCIKIQLSTANEYQSSYRIPAGGTGTTASNALSNMFLNTGGTFTGTPNINTTYYTSNQIV